jgi:hypothetical protein
MGLDSGGRTVNREPVQIWSIVRAPFLKMMTQSKYLAIWVAFVLLMVLTPFTGGPIGAIVLSIIFSFVLISGILTVSNNRRLLMIGLIPLTISLVARWIAYFNGSQDLQAVSAIFGTLTLAYVTILVFSALLKSKEVTSTIIWQAISVYLLIGLTWASLYLFLDLTTPGSFLDNSNPGAELSYPMITYYSFVTLATLGYGDIVPMTSAARGLAVLEVLTGVLYMAILISRLVGTWQPGTKS